MGELNRAARKGSTALQGCMRLCEQAVTPVSAWWHVQLLLSSVGVHACLPG